MLEKPPKKLLKKKNFKKKEKKKKKKHWNWQIYKRASYAKIVWEDGFNWEDYMLGCSRVTIHNFRRGIQTLDRFSLKRLVCQLPSRSQPASRECTPSHPPPPHPTRHLWSPNDCALYPVGSCSPKSFSSCMLDKHIMFRLSSQVISRNGA